MKTEALSVRLDGMKFYAFHGVLPQERKVGGHYTVSLELALSSWREAVENDALSGTVNYAEAYETVRAAMTEPSALLEHVAGRILSAIFQQFPTVERAVVEVRKDTPPTGGQLDGATVRLAASR